MPKHDHGHVADSLALYAFIGCTVKGLLHGPIRKQANPPSDERDTLVFACGWGLSITADGEYSIANADEVQAAIRRHAGRLTTAHKELDGILTLAGL